MRWTALLYWLVTAALAATVVLVVAETYRHGAASVPLWRDAAKPGELSPAHGFLSDRCEACHVPLRGVEAVGCVLCHSADAKTLGRQSTAFHASVQTCAACHVEHRGPTRPITMDHQALVSFGEQRHPERMRPVHQPQWFDRLMNVRATDGLDCFSCHSGKSPHRDLFGRQCLDCHATETWKVAGFRHPAASSTECAQCHQAPPSHYMGHFHMISKKVAGQEHARVEQCHLCHLPESWNSIRGVGWYKHH